MRKKFSINEEGFTLIELLIVIAIIGIFTTGFITIFNPVIHLQRGRDAQRKTNIRQMQSALELYRTDQANYPVTLTACGSSLVDPVNGTIVYMKAIPCDPSGGSYQYVGTSTTYTLVACGENTQDPEFTTTKPAGFTVCSSGRYFVVTNP